MGRNLGPLNIKDSYEGLVQISGSQLTDGSGSLISSLEVTASDATTATSASYAISASQANNATTATTATTASYVETAQTASYVSGANVDGPVTDAVNATSASYAVTASFAENVVPQDTGSLLVTASAVDATTTYTKGDGSTFTTTINNVSQSISSSYATTASYAENAVTPTLQQVTDEGATTSNPITITSTAAKTLVTEGGIEISSSTAPTLEIQSRDAGTDPSVLFQSGSTYVGFVAGTATHLELGDFDNNAVKISGSTLEVDKDLTANGDIIAPTLNAEISIDQGKFDQFVTINSDLQFTTSTDGTTLFANIDNNNATGQLVLDASKGTDIKNALTASGLNYPDTDGTVGQVLTTDGAGNLTLEDAAGGDAFPYSGSAIITGSLEMNDPTDAPTSTINNNEGTI